MKGFLILAIFSLSYGFYGHITKDTTWSDTVLITGDVVVDQNATLTISPGTFVLFSANSSIWDTAGGHKGLCDVIIYGKLKTNGYESDSITFTPDDTTGRWGGIYFINSGGDTLSYVKIMSCTHAIIADLSSIYITNTSIENAYGMGGVGVHASKSTLTLKEVNISNCYYLWPYNHTIGIYVAECSLELMKCQISNCKGADGIEGAGSPASGMDGIGIYSRSSVLRIIESTIKECKGGDAEGWEYPTFPGKGIGIFIEDTTDAMNSSFITKSNVYNNTDLNLKVYSLHALNAQYNYWGSIKEDEIIRTLVGKIHYSPWTDSTHTHSYHSKYFSGEITKDTVWSGKIWINGDVVVSEGITLLLTPGTKIFLNDKSLHDYGGFTGECDFIVHGKLVAIGTLKDSIHFSIDSLGRWGSIRIYGDNNDTLQYVTISHAWCGIDCGSASPLISNCKIQYIGGSGIVCANNASPQIIRNYISDCRGDNGLGAGGGCVGINCSSSSPKIIHNIIKYCIGGDATEGLPQSEMYGGWGVGIHCKGTSSPVIRRNVISDCRGGNVWNCFDPRVCIPGNGVCILCDGEASPKISLNKISTFVGGERAEWPLINRALSGVKEELFQGTGYGVACRGSSQPIIGGSQGTQNDISQDTGDCWPPYFFVTNLTPNDIIATYNWWGTTNQDTLEKYIYDHNDKSSYGYVIYKPWADASSFFKLLAVPPETVLQAWAPIEFIIYGVNKWGEESHYLPPHRVWIWSNCPNYSSDTVLLAKGGSKVRVNFMPPVGLEPVTYSFQARDINELSKSGSIEEIIINRQPTDIFINSEKDTIIVAESTEITAHVCAFAEIDTLNFAGDTVRFTIIQGKGILSDSTVLTDTLGYATTSFTGIETGEVLIEAKASNGASDKVKIEVIALTKPVLYQSCPNPFLEAITISYRLPFDGPVNVTIYESTGRAVKELVNEPQKLGYHEIHWQGRDNKGRELPSGVYFYRLETGDHQATKKIVLIR